MAPQAAGTLPIPVFVWYLLRAFAEANVKGDQNGLQAGYC